ncbi:hypothetical protein QBC37DRAFT_455430 [Rhypophila decipiens]|uniref:Uncharacterized protein n=1 Tax=Rhypophila decipiens TaxID=261697 RepID=A0AAN6XVL1_9PEZI|nr:hypothetical protein QBC37DRAFT_455430 [Rhypophila decipiens]
MSASGAHASSIRIRYTALSFTGPRRIVRHRNHGSIVTGDSFDRRGCDGWLFEQPVLPLRAFSPLNTLPNNCRVPTWVGRIVGRGHRHHLLEGMSARRSEASSARVLSAQRRYGVSIVSSEDCYCRLDDIIGWKASSLSTWRYYRLKVVVVVCSGELFAWGSCWLGAIICSKALFVRGCLLLAGAVVVCSGVLLARRPCCGPLEGTVIVRSDVSSSLA